MKIYTSAPLQVQLACHVGFFFTLICCSTSSPDVQSIFKFNDFSGYLRNAQYLTKKHKNKKRSVFLFP